MSTLDEIKSKIDIVDLVSEAGVKLRHAGKNYTGFCPFHDNKKTPAFVVWPESGTWRCFGQCNEGGDVFKFVMKREGIDFKEAMQKLAARAGVEIKEYTRESPQQKEAYENLRKLLEDSIIYYRTHLYNNKEILSYLKEKRGLTDTTIETFGLGYAPAGYDNFLKHFSAKGYSEQDLVNSGMLSEREDGKIFDRFRNRIMIPIRDENGKMTGFGARIVDPDDIPKFLNSPETPIFSKGRLLYGLDRARKPIRVNDQAVIVEGYLDVIALHQAGYENVVSPMGTALTEDQLRLLKKSTRRIVLALDPDVAGQKAVLRGLDAARSAMDKEGELAFDARGLLRNESRLQADLRVASIPDDLDPDEIVARDKEEWKTLIENAKPIVTHVMDVMIEEQDIHDPKVKTKIINQISPLINDIPDIAERDYYFQRLARILSVKDNLFANFNYQPKPVKKYSANKSKSIPSNEDFLTSALTSPRLELEKQILAVLLEEPELINNINRFLEEIGLRELLVNDFTYIEHQHIFASIRKSVQQYALDYKMHILNEVSETFLDVYNELLKHPITRPETKQELKNIGFKIRNSNNLLESALSNVVSLQKMTLRENNNQIEILKKEAIEQGDSALKNEYDKTWMQNLKLLFALDESVIKIKKRKYKKH